MERRITVELPMPPVLELKPSLKKLRVVGMCSFILSLFWIFRGVRYLKLLHDVVCESCIPYNIHINIMEHEQQQTHATNTCKQKCKQIHGFRGWAIVTRINEQICISTSLLRFYLQIQAQVTIKILLFK